MKIKNTSRIYTTQEIREAIRFVKPSGVKNFSLSIQNTSTGYYGKAFRNGKWVGVRIAKIRKFPYIQYTNKKGYIPFTLYTQKEVLYFILAHELRHLWQSKHKRGWRVWGAKGQFSEKDADAYAIHKVREYRRNEKT